MTGIVCAIVGNFSTAVAAQIIRYKKSIIANGNAQIDTAQSKFGGASALFDGTGDGLSIEHSGDMRFGTGDFTMEFWYRPAGRAQSYPLIFSNRTGFTSGNIVFHDRHNSVSTKLTIWIYNLSTSSPIFTSTTTTVDGTWYHVALSRSGTSLKMFINGTQEGSTYTTSADIDVGAGTSPYSVSYPGASSEFYGWVDEVRVSKSARYTANFTPSTTAFVNDDNTLLLIHADGTNGSTFFEDDNGVRAPKGITAIGNAQIDTAQSKFGGASALFDGTGDFLTADTNFTIGTGDFTIECWFRTAVNGATNYYIFDARSGANLAVIQNTNNINVFTGGAVLTGPTISTNTWYHMALVRSSGTATFYINGTGYQAHSLTTNFAECDFFIGCRFSQSEFWNGHLDEFRISNTARYTANFTAPTAPFVNDTNTLLLIHADGTDGSTVFRDDNGYSARVAKHISYYGNAQLDTAQSKFGGSSALFDGTDDYLVANYNTNFTSDFTVECWARFASISTDQTIWQFGTSATDALQIYLYTTAGADQYKIRLDIWGVTGAFSSTTVTTNTWYHFAVVRSSSTVTLYIDGTSRATVSRSANIGNGGNLYIGAREGATLDFNGHIDEFRISNSARYTANFTPATAPFQNDANTLLLMHMDGADAATTFVDDNGGRSAKGITALGNAQIDTAQSKFGGASALFDGTGDWLKGGFHPEYNFQGDFTIEFWARLNSNSGSYVNTITHAWGITGGLSGWYITTNAYNGTQKFGFSFVTNAGTKTELNYGSTLPLSTWMHLAVCRDGNKLYFYKDGVLLNSGGYTLTEGIRGFVNNYDFGIGASPYDQTGAYDGHLDEIRISNSARYPGGTTFTPSTTPFSNDSNTLLLIHADGTDGSTVFTDDNGKTPVTP